MAAPSSTKWGSTVGSYGRIGIYTSVSSTAIESTVTIQIWFWSKYSVSDTSNKLYFNDDATSATTSKGSVSISTTSDSGGWSTTNQKRLKTYTVKVAKGISAVTRKCSAKLTGVDRVGGTMKVTAEYDIPALTKYTITYNANGGEGVPSATTGYYGKSTKITTLIPSRENYTFLGWSTSSSATSATYSAGGTVSLTANLTLYAVWAQNAFTVTYNPNGGDGEPSPQIKTAGITLILSSTIPIREGYTFAGWGTSSNTTIVTYAAGASYTTDKSIVLYAVWTPWTHTVAFDANGGSDAPASITVTNGSLNILPITIPTYGKNAFKCWCTVSNINSIDKEDALDFQYFYAGGKYNIVQNGGTITLYAIWNEPTILFHDTGELECIEIIEDSTLTNCLFYNNGKIHCKEYIEGSSDGIAASHLGFIQFIEK